MKTLLTTATLAIATTVLSANVFAAQPQYDVKILNLDEAAMVKVTEAGQPVAGVPVTIEGQQTRVLTTEQDGSVIVRNNDNSAQALKISVTEPNGQVFTTERFIAN